MTPKSAAYILREHEMRGREFLLLTPGGQHAFIRDVLSKKDSSLGLLEEFRRGAAKLQQIERSRRPKEM